MSREDKKIELKPVEDNTVLETPVVRLESGVARQPRKPLRPTDESARADATPRLAMPERGPFELRTHQPGVEELIGPDPGGRDEFEEEWGRTAEHRNLPWGWFVLIGLLLAGAVAWSLTQVKESESQVKKAREESAEILMNDEQEEAEAAQLVERIHSNIGRFFVARSVGEMLPLIRQPERVRPLLEAYYSDVPVIPYKVLRTLRFEPLTIGKQASFWLTTVELEDHTSRNLIIDVRDPAQPLIDWETLVSHQPMDWDHFARDRPENQALDFRVYAQADNFFSHEFADSSKWSCFKLTTLVGEETIFGYAAADGLVAREILDVISQNNGQAVSLILRVKIPEGTQSRSGVVIEKLVCPRWIHVESPDSGS